MKTKKDFELRVINLVCKQLVLLPKQVLGSNRSRPFVVARQMIASLLKESLGFTLYEIRDALKYKNHASALHALKMHKSDYSIIYKYRKDYKALLEQFNLEDFDLELEEENLVKKNIELKTLLDKTQLDLQESIREIKELKSKLSELKESIFYTRKKFDLV